MDILKSINNICINSKEVKTGDLFVCIKGENSDGHDYVNEAVENGASAIVASHQIDVKVPLFITDDPKKYLTKLLNIKYNNPSNKLKIIAFTGTNGKTTSASLTNQMLRSLGKKTAYLGTLGLEKMNDNLIEYNYTTPVITDLYKIIAELVSENYEFLVMEVSSHALSQGRVEGIDFDSCVFLNISHDHLDYHKTFEEYYTAKSMLFKNLKSTNYAFLNADDFVVRKTQTHAYTFTYGIRQGDYLRIKYLDLTENGMNLTFLFENNEYLINTSLIGTYNAYNLLGSITSISPFIPMKKIFSVVPLVKLPKGRLEKIVDIQPYHIYVDYGHTPEAIFQVLKTVKEFSNGQIYSIIGCGGDRDKGKRKKIGIITSELSDNVVFTTDNPRNEDPLSIIEEMTSEITRQNYTIITSREQAINHVMPLLDQDDILIIFGKGHEQYQIINDQKIPFNDEMVVRRYIERS